MKNEYEIEINLYTDWINFLRVQLQKMKCIVNKTFTEDQISLGYFHYIKVLDGVLLKTNQSLQYLS